MKIYHLTPMGQRLARTTNNPDTANWRAIHALDALSYATPDQVAMQAGISEAEAAVALGTLKRRSPPLVEEQ